MKSVSVIPARPVHNIISSGEDAISLQWLTGKNYELSIDTNIIKLTYLKILFFSTFLCLDLTMDLTQDQDSVKHIDYWNVLVYTNFRFFFHLK